MFSCCAVVPLTGGLSQAHRAIEENHGMVLKTGVSLDRLGTRGGGLTHGFSQL